MGRRARAGGRSWSFVLVAWLGIYLIGLSMCLVWFSGDCLVNRYWLFRHCWARVRSNGERETCGGTPGRSGFTPPLTAESLLHTRRVGAAFCALPLTSPR